MGKQMDGKENVNVEKPVHQVRIEHEYNGLNVFVGNAVVWSVGYISATACCGVEELSDFTDAERGTQAQFNEGLKEFFDNYPVPSTPGYVQLVLTKGPKNKHCYQRKLEAFLKQRDNAFCTPWRKNPNSSNLIQVWLVAV
jgi:hypothetical protein